MKNWVVAKNQEEAAPSLQGSEEELTKEWNEREIANYLHSEVQRRNFGDHFCKLYKQCMPEIASRGD